MGPQPLPLFRTESCVQPTQTCQNDLIPLSNIAFKNWARFTVTRWHSWSGGGGALFSLPPLLYWRYVIQKIDSYPKWIKCFNGVCIVLSVRSLTIVVKRGNKTKLHIFIVIYIFVVCVFGWRLFMQHSARGGQRTACVSSRSLFPSCPASSLLSPPM